MSIGPMEVAAVTFSHLPGISAARSAREISPNKEYISMNRSVEAMNVLGYIPGIGVIIGIARIIFAAITCKGDNDIMAMQCLRGAFEILGLGPLMIISDPIVTAITMKKLEALES